MNMRQEMDLIDWLTMLSVFSQPTDIPAATENLCRLIPILQAQAYPPHAFCAASARYVEAQERRRAVPSLGEIEGPLRGWIERNPPTPEQRAAVVARINAEQARRLRHEVGG